MSPTTVVAYLALFVAVGAVFLGVNLLIGRLLRPNLPNEEKLDVYECGEATIGSSFVQFDLRFYVVALLFIIFDVEVALFFPWATVFGKATHLADPNLVKVEAGALTAPAEGLLLEMGVPDPSSMVSVNDGALAEFGSLLALVSFADVLVFFAVLMVGFAYVWRRGDLDWVRAVSRERALSRRPPGGAPVTDEDEAVLAA